MSVFADPKFQFRQLYLPSAGKAPLLFLVGVWKPVGKGRRAAVVVWAYIYRCVGNS
jgi:hypothetical protein